MKPAATKHVSLSSNLSANKEAPVNQKKEIRRFALVMLAFTIGMALLLFYEVSKWWIWYGYLAVWTILEVKIAKNLRLKWWHWGVIIFLILGIDLVVMEIVQLLK